MTNIALDFIEEKKREGWIITITHKLNRFYRWEYVETRAICTPPDSNHGVLSYPIELDRDDFTWKSFKRYKKLLARAIMRTIRRCKP